MHRRHALAVVALAAITVTAGCAGALAQEDGPPSDAERTVTVTATGEVTAEADQAVVQVSVVARGDTAEVARARLAANVSTMRAGLADANVSEDQIVTTGYDIFEERTDRPPGDANATDRQYVARQSFQITLADTDRVGAVVDAAVASGATQVEGVQFTLSEEARADARQEALQDAMDAARRNAETLAAAENLSVGGALHVTSTEVRPIPFAAEASVQADAGDGTTIDGGPVRVTATVEVVYEAL